MTSQTYHDGDGNTLELTDDGTLRAWYKGYEDEQQVSGVGLSLLRQLFEEWARLDQCARCGQLVHNANSYVICDDCDHTQRSDDS